MVSYLIIRGKTFFFNIGDLISSITLAVPSAMAIGQKIYALKCEYLRIHEWHQTIHQVEELSWQIRKFDYVHCIYVRKICRVILLVAIFAL